MKIKTMFFLCSMVLVSKINAQQMCCKNNSKKQESSFFQQPGNMTYQRTPSNTRTMTTPLFTIIFNELLNDSSTTILHGAHLQIKAIIAGYVDDIQTEVVYFGSFYILPGATLNDSSTLRVLEESSTTTLGTPVTITSSIAGTGKIAYLSLNNSLALTQQEITFSHEVVSNNVESMN